MNGKRKQYSNKFKARVALEAIKGDKTIAELSSMYEVTHVSNNEMEEEGIEKYS